ncbi:MAG: SCO family protein [Deltaproteobacteria bacterium]|nr:SCO family protein [Deltaproteobacteria bacterium]
METAVKGVFAFFSGWRFPVFVLSVLLFSKLLLVGVLLAPTGSGDLAAFALDFKAWCFGYDPATGKLEIAYVAMIFVEPLLIGGITLFAWWGPLRQVARRPRLLAPWVAAGFVVVALATAAFGVLTRQEDARVAEFPAEELRTERPLASFSLVDQSGLKVSSEDLRGRVAVVTAVYATCGLTCPMILAQAKRVVAELAPEERSGMSVVAITLDPERDTPLVLAEMAKAQQVSAPLFRLLSGEPAAVNRVLDELGFARKRDPKTGVIDHANLFLVVDRGGRVAYSFTLGENQERWLVAALKRVLAEDRPRT